MRPDEEPASQQDTFELPDQVVSVDGRVARPRVRRLRRVLQILPARVRRRLPLLLSPARPFRATLPPFAELVGSPWFAGPLRTLLRRFRLSAGSPLLGGVEWSLPRFAVGALRPVPVPSLYASVFRSSVPLAVSAVSAWPARIRCGLVGVLGLTRRGLCRGGAGSLFLFGSTPLPRSRRPRRSSRPCRSRLVRPSLRRRRSAARWRSFPDRSTRLRVFLFGQPRGRLQLPRVKQAEPNASGRARETPNRDHDADQSTHASG